MQYVWADLLHGTMWCHAISPQRVCLFFDFLIKVEVFELLDLIRCQINLFGSQLLVLHMWTHHGGNRGA